MATPELEVLRPALELALDVAVAGAAGTPPVEPPPRLRKVLAFARVDRMLPTVRAVLDADDGFRQRVADGADEAELGRVAWAFLTRPEGWAAEVREAVGAASAVAEDRAATRAESAATRRLAAAEAARERADAALASATAERREADRELAEERRRRRAAETQAAQAGRRAEEAEAALEQLLDRAERDDEQGQAERQRLRAEVERLTAEGSAAAPGEEAWDRAGAERALAAARRSLDDLATALDALRPVDGPAGVVRPVEALAPRVAGSRAARPASPRRRPTRLPPALLDDDAGVASHLLRVRGVLVLVDGYNVTKRVRPDLAIPEQRRWLTDRLAELAARTGASFDVVFDGAEPGGPPLRMSRANGVAVTFSPLGVEADDVVLARVAAVPLERPVVVVSDDRRVRTGAADRGANVLAVDQLLAATGR